MGELYTKIESRCVGCSRNCGLDSVKRAIDEGADVQQAVHSVAGEFSYVEGSSIIFCKKGLGEKLGILLVIKDYEEKKRAVVERLRERFNRS